jgi:predicted transposase YbfD/YdcC
LPGEPRFPAIAAIAKVKATVHETGKNSSQTRAGVTSRPLTAAAFAKAVQRHRAIENSLHWVPGVTFRDDAARSRTGHGPANMAVVHPFAFNIPRSHNA